MCCPGNSQYLAERADKRASFEICVTFLQSSVIEMLLGFRVYCTRLCKYSAHVSILGKADTS